MTALKRLTPKQAIGGLILLVYTVIAIAAPLIATHNPWETYSRENGTLAALDPPSWSHLLGTTNLGRDIFSQLVIGSRAALIVGLVAALVVTIAGTSIGLIAGYFGGWIDEVFMRLVDLAYAIPFVAFVIVLVSLLQPSLFNAILAICLLFWRNPARVTRAQVLSLKQRTFVKMARMAGAGDLRIIFVHLAPNVLPLAMVYMAISVGWAIITEASIAFLGLGDPLVITWGQMLNLAFVSGAMRSAWWWVVPPGVSIILVVTATFMIGEAVEEFANPRLRA